MSRWLTDEEFAGLFTSFDETAWHLETRGVYCIDEEQDAFARFLAGQSVGLDWSQAWLNQMREVTARGRQVRRVRLIDEPPTDYQRFELWATPNNIAAGEQIRTLATDRGRRLGLPDHDFWLFDSNRVVVSHFTDDGHLIGDELISDREAVSAHCRWWTMAWTNAMPYRTGEDET